MERLETQTCNGDSTSFEKEMLALLDEHCTRSDIFPPCTPAR